MPNALREHAAFPALVRHIPSVPTALVANRVPRSPILRPIAK